MASVETEDNVVKMSDVILELNAASRQAGVAAKQAALQAFVDETVARELGRRPGAPKSPELDGQLSRWSCSRCGSRRKGDLSYSGTYSRRLVFEEGPGELAIPRIRCACGGNVKPDFGVLLPKRKRLWYDLELAAVELHVEGVAYRGLKRHFARMGSDVGIGSLSRMLARFADVDINAGVEGDFVSVLGADAAFVRVGAGSRAHYYIHEILPRQRPLIRDGREVAWHRTGKVLACHHAAEESPRRLGGVLRAGGRQRFHRPKVPTLRSVGRQPGPARRRGLVAALVTPPALHLAHRLPRTEQGSRGPQRGLRARRPVGIQSAHSHRSPCPTAQALPALASRRAQLAGQCQSQVRPRHPTPTPAARLTRAPHGGNL